MQIPRYNFQTNLKLKYSNLKNLYLVSCILKFKEYVLDFLFPKYCVNCGKEGDSVCFSCEEKIIPVVTQVCPTCKKINLHGSYHKKCSSGNLSGIICASYYEEGPIKEMIHNFKYNGVLELGEPLAELMVEALKRNNQAPITNNQSNSNNQIKKLKIGYSLDVGHCDLIITFVPLHWHRQAQRGYNQAEILAQKIGENLDIEVCDLLVKKQSTRRQAELTGSNRRKNLSGVFKTKTNIDIKNKKIIIVDDVTTTGSTLNECAAVLKHAGAKEVWGLVVARG